jgi:hypothetical protein
MTMKTNTLKKITSIAATGLLAATAAQADFVYPDVAPPETIDICVAEIDAQANYEDATYVRHEVASRPRATLGHTLRINTLVYDETDGQLIRAYKTTCAVSNREVPVSFRIEEKNGA